MAQPVARGRETPSQAQENSMKPWQKVAIVVAAIVFVIGAGGIGASFVPSLQMEMLGRIVGGSLMGVGAACVLALAVYHYRKNNSFTAERTLTDAAEITLTEELTRQFEAREIQIPVSKEIKELLSGMYPSKLPEYIRKRGISSEKDKIQLLIDFIRVNTVRTTQLSWVLKGVGLELSSLNLSTKIKILKTLLSNNQYNQFNSLNLLSFSTALFSLGLPMDPPAMRAFALVGIKLCGQQRLSFGVDFIKQVYRANPPIFEKKEFFKIVYTCGVLWNATPHFEEFFSEFIKDNWQEEEMMPYRADALLFLARQSEVDKVFILEKIKESDDATRYFSTIFELTDEWDDGELLELKKRIPSDLFVLTGSQIAENGEFWKDKLSAEEKDNLAFLSFLDTQLSKSSSSEAESSGDEKIKLKLQEFRKILGSPHYRDRIKDMNPFNRFCLSLIHIQEPYKEHHYEKLFDLMVHCPHNMLVVGIVETLKANPKTVEMAREVLTQCKRLKGTSRELDLRELEVIFKTALFTLDESKRELHWIEGKEKLAKVLLENYPTLLTDKDYAEFQSYIGR